MSDDAGEVLLPVGARLLHIGPPKTGTTSLQAAFWTARDVALAQGVRYAGTTRHSARAVLAVTGRPSFAEDRASPPIEHWNALLREVRAAREPRVVISSEGFAYARPEVIPRIIDDLDPARVQVVVTLRPLPLLLSSEWQEQTQGGLEMAFDTWLDHLFRRPEDPVSVAFWHRQRHDALIARWARVAGADRLTVVVADDADHGFLLRAFERLTGLAAGTLAPDPELANRSLTLPEIEAIRALYVAFREAGMSRPLFYRVVRMKVAAYMKTRLPDPAEPRIETPRWALERAAEVALEMVSSIAASGVRVIGDLDRLTAVPDVGPDADGPDAGRQPAGGSTAPGEVRVSPEVAASMAMGMLAASSLVREERDGQARPLLRPAGGTPWIEPIELARVPTTRLARIVAVRLLADALHGATGRLRRVGRPRRERDR